MLVCPCSSAMVERSAKSHRYYYHTCNRNCKQGREACNSRILPKKKMERLVIDQIKNKILDVKYLEELVKLVNVELDTGQALIRERGSKCRTLIAVPCLARFLDRKQLAEPFHALLLL